MTETSPSVPASLNDHPGIGPLRFAFIALLFVLSGAAALIYEVVWTRQLTTLFGATIYAVATVLTAFMGGLALGAWWFGRLADRFQRPLLVFGLLEVGIAASAALFPTMLNLVTPIIGSFYATGGEGTFLFFSLVRFVIAFVLLMVPTTLMGATLPVLSRAVTRDFGAVGRSVGALYALNTFGAVLGVFLSGFYLLERLGVWKTTLVGIAADSFVAVCCIAMGLSLRIRPAREITDEGPIQLSPAIRALGSPERRRTIARVVLATYFLSGLAALAFQVAWTRSLIFGFDHLKATTYSFAGMLTVFLLGLTIGSALMQAVVDKVRDLLGTYVVIQVIIAIFGALTPWLINADFPRLLYWPELIDDGSGALNYWGAVGNVMIRTTIVIGIPTLMMGAAFPVVTRLAVGSMGSLGRDVGTVYAANTCGAIVGAFLSGFFLIPMLGLSVTIGLLAAIGFLNAIAVLWFHPMLPVARRPLVVGALAAVACLFIVRTTLGGRTAFQPLTIGETMVHYDEGSLATVSVIEDSKGWRTIYVDAVGVAGTDPVLQTDQKSLAHMPMVLLGGEAENVLSVGFGAGGASYSFTLYPGIRNIRTIEITSSVPRAAYSLTDANNGIVYTRRMVDRALRETGPDRPIPGVGNARPSARPAGEYVHQAMPGFLTYDPRFRIIADDARSYLRFTDQVYDVIATDCTDLRYKSNANLYDLEYFQLCRERISDRGLVVVWMPLAGLSDEAFRIVLRTFKAVFPEMTVWYFTNQPIHYCLFIGQKGGLKINFADVERALENEAIQGDMDEIGLNSAAKVVASFVTDNRGIDQYIGEGPLNTEDFPIIEFLSPRFGYDSRPIAQNMGKLYDVQVPVWDLIVDRDTPRVQGLRETLDAYQRANDILFEGHAHYRLFNFLDAARHYAAALEIAPDDESILRLLDFDELRLLLAADLERNPRGVLDIPFVNAQSIAVQLGRVYNFQERWSDTINTLAPFVRRHPAPTLELDADLRSLGRALNLQMAEAYRSAGNDRRANEYERQAAAYGE